LSFRRKCASSLKKRRAGKSRLRSVHGCGPQGAGRDWDHATGELDDSWHKAAHEQAMGFTRQNIDASFLLASELANAKAKAPGIADAATIGCVSVGPECRR
jgi:hypothetical protein